MSQHVLNFIPLSQLLSFFFQLILFINFFCAGSSLLRGLLTNYGVQASHCGGFSLQSTGSRTCRLP